MRFADGRCWYAHSLRAGVRQRVAASGGRCRQCASPRPFDTAGTPHPKIEYDFDASFRLLSADALLAAMLQRPSKVIDGTTGAGSALAFWK